MASNRLPIGVDDFRELIEQNYLWVDKTEWIAKILTECAKVFWVTRPRRFGKTLNLSMLCYFLDCRQPPSIKAIFQKLAIAEHGDEVWRHFRRYPVILWSLKDVRGKDFETSLALMAIEMARLYESFKSDLWEHLSQQRQAGYQRILACQAHPSELAMALRDLSIDCHRVYGEPVWIVIDEYDTPIHEACLKGYYDDMIDLIRSIFSSALKGNPSLHKAVITGILRVAKESLFSGLNQVWVDSVITTTESPSFGFTEKEVHDLLMQTGHAQSLSDVRRWYNGYRMGGEAVYNPWSVLSFIKRGQYAPFWVNTAHHGLLSRVLAKSDGIVKRGLERLLEGESIRVEVDEHMVLGQLERHPNTLWYLLLASGYLTLLDGPDDQGACVLSLPNFEITRQFERLVRGWFEEVVGLDTFHGLLEALVQGYEPELQDAFSGICARSLSYFDAADHQSERFYHAFVLGMVVALQDRFHVRSNRESGLGRFDVMLVPKSSQHSGVVLEFKQVLASQSMDQAADEALAQVKAKRYTDELQALGVQHSIVWAIVFKGKDVLVKKERA